MLSKKYHQVATVLKGGWTGTYGDLAKVIGGSQKAAKGVGSIVRVYARRHPAWPHERVFAKRTGKPAYMS